MPTIESDIARIIGNLNPPTDEIVWVDTQLPDRTVQDSTPEDYQTPKFPLTDADKAKHFAPYASQLQNLEALRRELAMFCSRSPVVSTEKLPPVPMRRKVIPILPE